MTAWRLVADVGGTNARFAHADSVGTLYQARSYEVASFSSFIDALQTYLDETGRKENCIGAAIGAAGPVCAGAVKLTNASWTISQGEISAYLNAPAILVNDIEAAAFSLPELADDELLFLGEPAFRPSACHRLLAANAGTGFGAATLLHTGLGWISCPSEAGHMKLAAASQEELDLLKGFGSVEDVLSGGGVVKLYEALRLSGGKAGARLAAHEVFARAGKDEHAAATLRLFTQILARTLGDLTLAVAAWDGVFLFGSVAKGWAAVADFALFRRIFEDKGPMRDRMKRAPAALVLKEDAALAGLAYMPLPC